MVLRVVGGTRIQLTTDKGAWTLRSRQDLFMRFFQEVHLGNNISLIGFTQVVRNVIMAGYVAHLVSGQTLLYRYIKSYAIRKYLKATSNLSIPFQMMNSTMDLQAKELKLIKDMFRESHRWEFMTKCREPITKNMISFVGIKGHPFHYKTTSTPS